MDFIIYILFLVGLAMIKVLTPDTPAKYVCMVVLGIVYVLTMIDLHASSDNEKQLEQKNEEIKKLEHKLTHSLQMSEDEYKKTVKNIKKYKYIKAHPYTAKYADFEDPETFKDVYFSEFSTGYDINDALESQIQNLLNTHKFISEQKEKSSRKIDDKSDDKTDNIQARLKLIKEITNIGYNVEHSVIYDFKNRQLIPSEFQHILFKTIQLAEFCDYEKSATEINEEKNILIELRSQIEFLNKTQNKKVSYLCNKLTLLIEMIDAKNQQLTELPTVALQLFSTILFESIKIAESFIINENQS